jgi:hypothetical protein
MFLVKTSDVHYLAVAADRRHRNHVTTVAVVLHRIGSELAVK